MKASNDDEKLPEPECPSRRAEVWEIRKALLELEQMTPEKIKLYEIARYCTRAAFLKNDHEDLLQDAIMLTLDEREYWFIDKKPTIFEHLRWLIVDLAKRRYKKLSIPDEKNKQRIPRVETFDPSEHEYYLRNSPQNVSVEDRYDISDMVERIYGFFYDDPKIRNFLEESSLGYSKDKIIERLNITETEFETIRKRIYRKKSKLLKLLGIRK